MCCYGTASGIDHGVSRSRGIVVHQGVLGTIGSSHELAGRRLTGVDQGAKIQFFYDPCPVLQIIKHLALEALCDASMGILRRMRNTAAQQFNCARSEYNKRILARFRDTVLEGPPVTLPTKYMYDSAAYPSFAQVFWGRLVGCEMGNCVSNVPVSGA